MTISKQQQRKPRVIDVGCGPGIYVSALQARGVDAIGVDIDPWTPCIVADLRQAGLEIWENVQCYLQEHEIEELREHLADQIAMFEGEKEVQP